MCTICKDVKLRQLSRGQWPTHETTANGATHGLGGYRDISGLIIPTYLQPFLLNGKGLSPRTSMPIDLFLSCHFYLMDYMHGFRNLNFVLLLDFQTIY